MNIGLVDVDSKIPNLALMKISAHHKKKGDEVEFYNPMFNYEKVYMSKIFTYTRDYMYPINADTVVKGGSGCDLSAELPEEIENIKPDYDLYNIDYAMGFTTRGCIRNCDFCLVPEKEGKIKSVADIYDFWDGQETIMIMDNNLTAHNKQFNFILDQLIEEQVDVNFSQGLDIRLINKKKAKKLSHLNLKHNRVIHFAFDDIQDKELVEKNIKILLDNGVKYYRMTFYVLIGFNSTPKEDLERINLLKKYKVNPFVMPYKDINGYDMDKIIKRCGFDSKHKYYKYLKDFARWVNHKAIFKSIKWEDYNDSI